MTNRIGYLIAFTALCIAAALLLPVMPQPTGYHLFADRREMFGIVNFMDVASNAAFLLAGLAGLALVLRPGTCFASNGERWPYGVFFLGMLLTAAGSAYYHLVPDNERLFWDRLPMTIAFMSLIAAQVVDRISVKAGLALLVPMLLVGAASVVHWRATERAEVGNVIPYGILQGYSVVILLLIALAQPSRYTQANSIYWVFAAYVIAKVLELFDAQLLALGDLVSGHTAKHLAAAAAGFEVCRMLARRTLVEPALRGELMRSAIRSVAFCVCLLGVADGARADLAAWDQAKVTELAKQLEAATAALSDSLRRQQPPTLGSGQRKPFFQLQHEVRHLRREARSMSTALQRGADQEETLPSYVSLMRAVRSASDLARRVFTGAELQGRADAARAILNQLAPYYDPEFTPLEPPARR